MKSFQQQQQEWFEENAALGRALGYPECCIKEFCDQPPSYLQTHGVTKDDRLRYKAACINGVFSGFIPCIKHAKQILAGEITLHSLIKSRDHKLPRFPDAFTH